VVARISGCEGSSGIRECVLGEPKAPVWKPPLWKPEGVFKVEFHPPVPIPVNVDPILVEIDAVVVEYWVESVLVIWSLVWLAPLPTPELNSVSVMVNF
jgi:hypothetical protein